MHEELRNGRRVTVHCSAGQQRSPAVVAAYLMQYHGMELSCAISHIRQCKLTFFFQVNFMDALERFSDFLRIM
jgi:protein-tyrosine phosphatase